MISETKQKELDIVLILLLILLSTAERIQILGIPLYFVLFIPCWYRFVSRFFSVNKGKIILDRFELFILLWLFVGLILSVIYGLEDGFRDLESLIINVVIIFTFYNYDKEHYDYNVLIGLMCGLLFNLIIGVLEIHINGFHVVTNFNEYYKRIFMNKAVGFQVNANDYCAMLVVYIIALIYLVQKLEIKSRLIKALVFCSIIVSVYIIIVDFSRAAILSLFFIFVYILIYCLFGKKRWQLISVFLFVVGLILLVSTDLFENGFSAFMDANSDKERISIYLQTWNFIKDHFFLGVGPGNTTYYMGMSPHNLLFEVLSDYGIIVTVPFVLALLKLMHYKIYNDNGKGYYIIALFGICFFFEGFSVSSLLRNRICWVLFAYFSRQLIERCIIRTDKLPSEEVHIFDVGKMEETK